MNESEASPPSREDAWERAFLDSIRGVYFKLQTVSICSFNITAQFLMSSDIPSSSNQAQSRKHSLDIGGSGNERAVKLAHTPSTNRSSVPANSPLWAVSSMFRWNR